MAKRGCPEGTKWDNLVIDCVNATLKAERHTAFLRPSLRPPTGQPPLAAARPEASVASVRASSAVMLSPALWSCVVLATLGSILALGVWLFIYRRQRRRSCSLEASVKAQEPLQEPLDKQSPTETDTLHEAPSHCPHLHEGPQPGYRWGDGSSPTACRGPAGPAAALPARTAEHRIPLPATELGGTALVTTKTV